MRHRALLVLGLGLLLSACGGSGKVQSASQPTVTRPATGAASVRRPRPQRRNPPPPVVQAVPGVEGVIGSSAASLTRLFGTPRLDVWEGDARKLQFSGNDCVLDVFLYPAAPGQEPRATYVETRRPAGGRDVERAACFTALRQR